MIDWIQIWIDCQAHIQESCWIEHLHLEDAMDPIYVRELTSSFAVDM